MAVYAIGDVQGCLTELETLFDELAFDPARDRLWFVGDIVNRGPDSLGALRLVKSLDASAHVVLGNHDLHLLAVGCGLGKPRERRSLESVLKAPDRDELLDWLRTRPLLHHDADLGFTMIHAGLPPAWDLQQARDCAAELEATLGGDSYRDFLAAMYGNKPRRWDPALTGHDRMRFITNCFTRLRFCEADGRLALKEKGRPGTERAGRVPWFEHPQRASRGERIVCGHWSTLGYRVQNNVWSIDSGCLWGGSLTALRLDVDPPKPIHLPCARNADPFDYL